jgi:hypothetical protein
MKIVIALSGAFLSAILLLALVDVYTPGRNMLNLPIFIFFFVIWSVGFGYATIEANLKKKITAVLAIEGIALAGSSGYFMFTRGFSENIFGLTLGVASLVIMILLRTKKEEE